MKHIRQSLIEAQKLIGEALLELNDDEPTRGSKSIAESRMHDAMLELAGARSELREAGTIVVPSAEARG